MSSAKKNLSFPKKRNKRLLFMGLTLISGALLLRWYGGTLVRLIAVCMILATPALAAPSVQPHTGPLLDYCTAENLPPANCTPNTFFELASQCDGTDVTVAAVGCSLQTLNNSPSLVANRVGNLAGTALTSGACIYSFSPVPATLPMGTVTLRCVAK